jgi:Leucine-rich repeat (LRR) protein
MPIFYGPRFRLDTATPLAQLIVDEFHRQNSDRPAEHSLEKNGKSNAIEQYIAGKVVDFGITANGLCKYCSVFNMDVSSMQPKPSYKLDKTIKKLIKSNDEYSKIITSLNVSNERVDQDEEAYSISLVKAIFKHLPNLSNLSIRNVHVKEFESSIENCTGLKNVELVNNNLRELPENWPPITQLVVDNNPITSVPANLFCIESLRSLVLNRLNIESLPDGWLSMCTDNVCNIRSIRITQTRLKLLPEDLIIGNRSLEQLVFQGLSEILKFS